ncbi:histone-lysine N-methyltransferase SETMAR [Trichonephila clavipes]|nr:histone-lysine N-methyltransferase SETMAR [Trichonephila clavipes]
MATEFWNQRGVLLVNFGPHKEQRSTQVPTAQLYGSSKNITKQTAWHAVKGVFLLHENARPLPSRTTPDLGVLHYAPYSPDIAPNDFLLFRYLKHSHDRKCFSNNEDVKADENSWLSDRAADFFEEGFQNLVLRYDKCIN